MTNRFIKKHLSLSLSTTLLVAIVACGGGGRSSDSTGSSWTQPSVLTGDALSVAGQDAVLTQT